jgi:DNA modification methylase
MVSCTSELIYLADFVPNEINLRTLTQPDFPRIAKDKRLMAKIIASVKKIPTKQIIVHGDSRTMTLNSDSIHLIVTSPPYWTLKRYDPIDGQLGTIRDYDQFLAELDEVWKKCYYSLVPGGRMVVVVGDVCLSRSRHNRHRVIPLHSSIQERCRAIGFDNLAPIIWYKIANIKYEVKGTGRFLGKPYEPNAIIKNDIEYILFMRKPGRYRSPDTAQRVLSLIPEDEHRLIFQQIWNVPGSSTRKHPAPFPLTLAERLVRMFSFVGDTVFDPFLGTGTTIFAAGLWGRNGIGYEIDEKYMKITLRRLKGDIKFTDVNPIDEIKQRSVSLKHP